MSRLQFVFFSFTMVASLFATLFVSVEDAIYIILIGIFITLVEIRNKP